MEMELAKCPKCAIQWNIHPGAVNSCLHMGKCPMPEIMAGKVSQKSVTTISVVHDGRELFLSFTRASDGVYQSVDITPNQLLKILSDGMRIAWDKYCFEDRYVLK